MLDVLLGISVTTSFRCYEFFFLGQSRPKENGGDLDRRRQKIGTTLFLPDFVWKITRRSSVNDENNLDDLYVTTGIIFLHFYTRQSFLFLTKKMLLLEETYQTYRSIKSDFQDHSRDDTTQLRFYFHNSRTTSE